MTDTRTRTARELLSAYKADPPTKTQDLAVALIEIGEELAKIREALERGPEPDMKHWQPGPKL